MVTRVIIECKTCKSKIMIRTQLSDVEKIPINIHCGNCGISISGKLSVSVERMKMNLIYKFDNANISKERPPEKSDYYIETSSEFLTKKMTKTNTIKSYKEDFSMFLRGVDQMGPENLQDFINRFNIFRGYSKTIWPIIRKLNELWFNKKYDLIENELKKYYPKRKFLVIDEFDSFRIIHKLNVFFFWNIMDNRIFDKTRKMLTTNIKNLTSIKMKELLIMCNYFGENSYLKKYTEKIFMQYKYFVENFNSFIPVFGLQFYKKIPDGFYERFGITTVSFENIKQFYIDLYETLLEGYILIVAYNNLKLRDNFDLMKKSRSDVKTISDFKEKPKGVKLSYLENPEEFDFLIISKLDNTIRNAIAHNSYKYDGVSQILHYYPKGDLTTKNTKQIYLLQILETCWKLFQSLILLSELIYETTKVYYIKNHINKGLKPNLEIDENLNFIIDKILYEEIKE